MGEVYAPRTIAGRRSGLRHWAHFACNLMGWDLLLFQQPVEQSVDSILTAETKIMCFARYLVRDYKSSTVIKYCYDVQSAHLTWLGAPLKSLGAVFFRLPLLYRWVKRQSPSSVRVKKPWEAAWFFQVCSGWLGDRTLFGAMSADYEKAAAYTIMVLAFGQLMRASELTRTPVASVSEYGTLTVSDAIAVRRDGSLCTLAGRFWQRYGADGAPDFSEFTEVQLRMPPSKKDPTGRNSALRLAVNADQDSRVRHRSDGFVLLSFAAAHLAQVPVRIRTLVPLFRGEAVLPPRAMPVMKSTRFLTLVKAFCREASPSIWYTGLGLHCFRVGGCNRLIELGATVAQIMALGRWASQCWELYARRNSESLFLLSREMARVPVARLAKVDECGCDRQVANEGGQTQWRCGGADHRWIGLEVRKKFERVLFTGKIVAWLPETSVDPALWKVEYTDGDVEDLEDHEVVTILVEQKWAGAESDSSGSDTEDDW